ncbi:hypothetical protein EWM64_g9905 [Hericium alpestre]|uniref:Uncharacterized protein n=1 Tax=Hericium alpestre TaxID=135208 RepID=A0A4Y9ZH81_9AGAM|nr:hypothetical protein EWM64_g9905 [Hericium alpestre]
METTDAPLARPKLKVKTTYENGKNSSTDSDAEITNKVAPPPASIIQTVRCIRNPWNFLIV